MNLKEQLMRDEGVRKHPYKCTADKTTIGVGRNLEDVGLSDDEIKLLLLNDIDRVETQLRATFPGLREKLGDDNENARWSALCNMTFQLGIGGVSKFKNAIAAMQEQDWKRAASEMLDSRWAKQTPERANRVATQMREGVWV